MPATRTYTLLSSSELAHRHVLIPNAVSVVPATPERKFRPRPREPKVDVGKRGGAAMLGANERRGWQGGREVAPASLAPTWPPRKSTDVAKRMMTEEDEGKLILSRAATYGASVTTDAANTLSTSWRCRAARRAPWEARVAREVEACEREIAQKVEAEEKRLELDVVVAVEQVDALVEQQQQQQPLDGLEGDVKVVSSPPSSSWAFDLNRSATWIEERYQEREKMMMLSATQPGVESSSRGSDGEKKEAIQKALSKLASQRWAAWCLSVKSAEELEAEAKHRAAMKAFDEEWSRREKREYEWMRNYYAEAAQRAKAEKLRIQNAKRERREARLEELRTLRQTVKEAAMAILKGMQKCLEQRVAMSEERERLLREGSQVSVSFKAKEFDTKARDQWL